MHRLCAGKRHMAQGGFFYCDLGPDQGLTVKRVCRLNFNSRGAKEFAANPLQISTVVVFEQRQSLIELRLTFRWKVSVGACLLNRGFDGGESLPQGKDFCIGFIGKMGIKMTPELTRQPIGAKDKIDD